MNSLDHTRDILDDVKALVPMGGVTVPRFNEESKAGLLRRRDFIVEKAQRAGLTVIEMKEDELHPVPYIVLTFPEMLEDDRLKATVALVGHLDVVGGNETQFQTRIEGGFIHGRGTTDMLTVDATFLEWMIAKQREGGKKPPFLVMLSCTEENDSALEHNTYTAREFLEVNYGARIELAVVGERTGEMEDKDDAVPVPFDIRNSNYGLRRYELEVPASTIETAADLELIRFLARRVTTIRLDLDEANISDQVTTSFAQSFLNFQGSVPSRPSDFTFFRYKIPQGNSMKHSAKSSPSDQTPLEKAWIFFRKLKETLGQGYGTLSQVHVDRIAIGELGVFNRISKETEMLIRTKHLPPELLGRLQGELEHEGGRFEEIDTPSYGDPHLCAGIEIREAPQHADLVSRIRTNFASQLRRVNRASLRVATERSAWTCPRDNPHFTRLKQAYEEVSGRAWVPKPKVFFNDGSAFRRDDSFDEHGIPHANAVIFGQTGRAPHGDQECHYIPSIRASLENLDAFAAQYIE